MSVTIASSIRDSCPHVLPTNDEAPRTRFVGERAPETRGVRSNNKYSQQNKTIKLLTEDLPDLKTQLSDLIMKKLRHCEVTSHSIRNKDVHSMASLH